MTIRDPDAIPHTVDKTRKWVTQVSDALAEPDEQRAWRAMRAVLHALRDRLPLETLAHLSAQLPMLVRGLLFEGWDPTGKPSQLGRAEFLEHVRVEARLATATEAEAVVRAVVDVLWDHCSEGLMEHVAGTLPLEFTGLLY